MQDRIQESIKLKHTQQQASLIGQLSKLGCLGNADIYIEWGAGKGELSYFLYQALPPRDKATDFLLIDRDAGRLKFDSRIMKKAQSQGQDDLVNIVRHKVDIAHIDLAKMIEVEFPGITDPIICSISKHLCGSATDLTLSCLRSYSTSRSTSISLLVAVCCHQLCTWAAFSPESRTFFLNAGIQEKDFNILCRLTSWHTSGPSAKAAKSDEAAHWTNLTYAERSAIGWNCKRLIDSARVASLRASGWTAEVIKYEDIEVTTECYALLATKN
ncbi:protein of unknown function [Taphrina deformans PYCC 5710]|uniref:tRNA:m(4)X modification enzyme TRM13 n=1 Tax=Taphrina deformans (strain PYCC 5710 / ATCC 11124 / CBS 356.35 / IMI 108563 / JCM 9778 / NBRC 8474) TaxID=1097556 RepID=R4XFC2_TAPDE|nr:protein of unknown function [Taphrina deformans PYCC 5710]|eukprot:CCG84368.1 protein of unknown function [Taphrina deformans PYCC 5710]